MRRRPYRPARLVAIDETVAVLTMLSMRIRKLIGAVALLLLVVVWAFAAMAFAQFALTSANQMVATLYYVVAGLGWVLVAMPLVSWMSQRDRA
jgi:uncharacterized protein DUF2842